MSEADDPHTGPGEPGDPTPKPAHGGPVNQPLHHAPVGARISPQVSRGVLSTGVIVFEGPGEFVVDFIQRLGAPHAIVARVVMTPLVFGQLIAALRENLRMYEQRFGPPPALPALAGAEGQQSTIEQVYEQLKLPDELLSGVYANVAMIGHSPAEFWFDFITNFYPRSAVSSRVCLAAQQVPRLLEAFVTSYEAHRRKRKKNDEG